MNQKKQKTAEYSMSVADTILLRSSNQQDISEVNSFASMLSEDGSCGFKWWDWYIGHVFSKHGEW